MIFFFNEDISLPKIEKAKYKNWIKSIITAYNSKVGDINFIFCSNDYILDINTKYLSHNYFTDIITFNYNESEIISGDIFISLETVESNSLEYAVPFSEELKRVMIHGILHLLGFDDATDEQKSIMRSKETEAIFQFPS
jgi:rRNA maturation RNase YbeY